MKTSLLKTIKENVSCDQVSKTKNGTLIFRQSYYYKMNRTADTFKHSISVQLSNLGLSFEVLNKGDIWKPFKGGASVKAQSHFYVEVKISE